MRVNAGCGTHYAEGWLNTDLVENEHTHPDLIVSPLDPMPFSNASIEQVMLGHVLEHVPLAEVPGFLAEVRRTLVRGGEVLVVGPDVYRTIQLWKEGREPWALVQSVLEHAAYPGSTDWPQALHAWNCHESRVVEMLTRAGFDQVKPLNVPPEGWPVVAWAEWQCCVSAVRP